MAHNIFKLGDQEKVVVENGKGKYFVSLSTTKPLFICTLKTLQLCTKPVLTSNY